MEHLITLKEWSPEKIRVVLDLAKDVKANPDKYGSAMARKTLLMIFEKPSLRTRLSFESGMTQMGGHAIYYHTGNSPMGSGKETISDSVKAASRFVDVIMARLFKHGDLLEMAEYATVPVINALTDDSHPCQILADLQAIEEKKGVLAGLKLAYLGDGFNNVTHSLMFGGTKMGMHVSVGSPAGEEYSPRADVVADCAAFASASGGSVAVSADPVEAIKDADVVYTDSWMSYHIPKDQEQARIAKFMPYQVSAELMAHAKPDAIFMNCLPAIRGCEQTAEVIDGPQSIVFDEAENRLHAQKAVVLNLCNA
ncbi:ornithine carbamoyltransferase [Pontiella sulfatireligans]|uniref:Ornithine carbamoyltransferase n=1 Tax=Pontiella sulfatireligans TaxID=2750658 RepID=A0A6C2UE60_9BACT|nr:ornithine carbamoyltransferase [Pontiella sulfatireligans]VGO18502.1 Ornithine carbamoyltransferase [Pontiella sulfatireligans]